MLSPVDSYATLTTTTIIVILTTLSFCAAVRYRRGRRRLPLPPGPRKLPIVGNLFDIPSTFQWKAYAKWAKEFDSDIIHLSVCGTSIIVLSSLEATDMLLEKRIYSDRPRFPMLNELMGWDWNIGLMKYGMRTQRRLLQETLNSKKIQQYEEVELAGARKLLERLLHSPERWEEHVRQMAGELIMAVTYGIQVLPSHDPYIATAHEAVRSLSTASLPGRFLVDTFPILKFIPRWMPGAEFKRQAEKWTKVARDMIELPFAETKRQMECGTAPPSVCANSLDALLDPTQEPLYYNENQIKHVAGALFVGGADTTVYAISNFILAMIWYPEVQKKAQAEIDAVIGRRLPEFADRKETPYVMAVVLEVLRWKTVGPLALPRSVTEDDQYRGYRIPAGSVVLGNAWAILHDERLYPDPYTFKPERFLLNGKLNPEVRSPDMVFGFGRRRCPGKPLALSSVWITIVSMLAAYDIGKAVDENGGGVIEPTYENTPGSITGPVAFKCSFKARSKEVVALVQKVEDLSVSSNLCSNLAVINLNIISQCNMLSLDYTNIPSATFAAVAIILVSAVYAFQSRVSRRPELPLPPGPRKLPVVGNLFDVPPTFQFKKFTQWSKEYNSDILHLNVVGTSMIVLSSFEATDDLLERRSAIYSDRHRFPMVNELMGWHFNIGLMKYGIKYTFLPSVFQLTGPNDLRRRMVGRLLVEALSDSQVVSGNSRMAGELTIAVAYGIKVLSSDDRYLALANEAAHSFSLGIIPGAYLVDTFPSLKYIPSWMPGAGFKRKAKTWSKLSRQFLESPFAETKRQMDLGIAPPSFSSEGLQALENADKKELYFKELHVKQSAAAVFVGGVDTTVSALNTFILAMILFPEVQKKAQAVIDSHTEGKVLPTFADEPSLPYITAVAKESMRWENVAPLILPHLLTEEDEYRGYRLPAGSIVFGNAWAILHDEKMYPDPHNFKPERFLLNGKINPAIRSPDTVFGFGRRYVRCPGKHMALSSIWITIASILATYDIVKTVDENGNLIEPTHEYISGAISGPVPFRCTFKPRSKEALALIKGAHKGD
ncbi:cytochrome P450 [Favolaschia claudopus]|uniref:Cytochrome P450 n=1 Tax=Favolaschia claudopus TaxID=2862362 RepID=A0AAW0AYE9_9AGAR